MDISYIAGFFDADGTVFISRYGAKAPRLTCGFTNNHIGVLQDIQAFLGANGHYAHMKADGRRNVTHQLIYRDRQALDVLTRMVPYLVIKRDRALLGIQFQVAKTGRNHRKRTVSDHISDEQFRQDMLVLMGTSRRSR